MAIETMLQMDGHRPGHQAAVSQERPTIIRSPYPDVEVPEVSLPAFVLEQAEDRGDAPALIDALTGRTLTYRDLASAVRRVAAGLQAHGVAKGDVLALCSPNGPEFVITYFAAASAGAVITTMNPAATGHDIVTQLVSAGARWLVTTPELFEEKGRQAAAEAGIRESFVFGEADGATPFASLSEATRVGSPVDLVIDCTGLEHGLEYHALLQDLVTHHQLGRNPKGRLKVSNDFEVIGMGNGDGHVYAGGIMTLGGPHAAQDSFLGLQYSALRSVDALAALRAPGVHHINGLRSLRQWFRWARGVHP